MNNVNKEEQLAIFAESANVPFITFFSALSLHSSRSLVVGANRLLFYTFAIEQYIVAARQVHKSPALPGSAKNAAPKLARSDVTPHWFPAGRRDRPRHSGFQ